MMRSDADHEAMDSLVIRPAHAADAASLQRLAQLDSRRLPAGPHLIAELDGRAVAALSRRDGAAVADPFTHTADIVALLRRRADQLSDAPPRRSPLLLRRPATT
jgi:hypothetical protein